MRIPFQILSLVLSVLSVPSVSSAAPVRSMLGATETEIIVEDGIPENPTAADYIQEGLIAQWDGIENVGYGLHEDNPANFVDLVGINNVQKYLSPSPVYSAPFSGVALCGQPYIRQYASADLYSSMTNAPTVEWVFEDTSGQGNRVGVPILISGHWLNLAGFVGQRFLIYNRGNAKYITPPHSSVPYKVYLTVSVDTDGIVQVFLNGNYVDSIAPGTMAPPANGRIWIGQNLNLVDNSKYFALCTHSLRVYNRTLTATEIRYNHLIDKIRFNLP